ncbi:hypothetical protein [Streptococcus gallolyticus]|uniref:hypothetical protein n=1 Tax=Streptococcus gallolyticus TaxID=315405 RepID=UPI0001E0EBA5|nr:hypothetical protein [Streptococcus gallolyticus]EFM30263.1 hypothetical protein HMPREF9352_0377 [Streptococcus gallolyticus subsp. gallolyticus TX20005]QBX15925.1 hypothetical protein Javan227_0015 [Streptococcus phage Javan227]QKI01117.1 hypothetical protein FOC63_06175 [Streptococcus gallolyticus]QWX87188.1 hypothetical protein JGX27_02265 [Streptococcus gallolyticus subsp. gallolyticus TX20005]
MDVKETILNQHKTLKRIEELQKFMHGTSMLALGLHEDGVIEQPEDKLIFFETIHVFSHILEDVLNGKDVPEAARDVLFPDEDKD